MTLVARVLQALQPSNELSIAQIRERISASGGDTQSWRISQALQELINRDEVERIPGIGREPLFRIPQEGEVVKKRQYDLLRRPPYKGKPMELLRPRPGSAVWAKFPSVINGEVVHGR